MVSLRELIELVTLTHNNVYMILLNYFVSTLYCCFGLEII